MIRDFITLWALLFFEYYSLDAQGQSSLTMSLFMFSLYLSILSRLLSRDNSTTPPPTEILKEQQKEESLCIICLENLSTTDSHRFSHCKNHYFHKECLTKWSKIEARCPLCNALPSM